MWSYSQVHQAWNSLCFENPRSSKLFLFPPLVHSVACGSFHFVDFAMCQYGEQFQKNTRLVTSVGWLNPLAKKCHHKQHEVWLKGKVKVQQRDRHPIYVSKTALAGAYPWKFACRYAELIKHNVEFRAGNQEEVLQWGAALRSAAAIKRKPAPPRSHSPLRNRSRSGAAWASRWCQAVRRLHRSWAATKRGVESLAKPNLTWTMVLQRSGSPLDRSAGFEWVRWAMWLCCGIILMFWIFCIGWSCAKGSWFPQSVRLI